MKKAGKSAGFVNDAGNVDVQIEQQRLDWEHADLPEARKAIEQIGTFIKAKTQYMA